MSLFVAMLIGILGTILIERGLRRISGAAIRVPVRNKNKRRYHHDEN